MITNVNQQEKIFKIVLLGDSEVGKTSIITNLISSNNNEKPMVTLGATNFCQSLHIPNADCKIKLDIWDTAGQERFRAISKLFFKDAHAIILVYDITKKSSFESLKDYWIKAVKEEILSLCGNKSDLYALEEVEEKEGRKFAEELNALYKLTSIKDSDVINDLFKEIGEKLCAIQFDRTPSMSMNSTTLIENRGCCF